MQIIEDIKNTPVALIMGAIHFNDRFVFRGKEYQYFIHHRSWATERVVEIPIILNYIEKDKKTLEVGNVLSQFVDVWWDVVDKFEQGKDIINEDIIDFKPDKKYDLIVSISTFEHIGFNEDVGGGEKPDGECDDDKIRQSVDSLKRYLKPGGVMVATVPLGYNKKMDMQLFDDRLGFDEVYFLKRVSKWNLWEEVKIDEVVEPKYGHPYPCANYICVVGLFQGE